MVKGFWVCDFHLWENTKETESAVFSETLTKPVLSSCTLSPFSLAKIYACVYITDININDTAKAFSGNTGDINFYHRF